MNLPTLYILYKLNHTLFVLGVWNIPLNIMFLRFIHKWYHVADVIPLYEGKLQGGELSD